MLLGLGILRLIKEEKYAEALAVERSGRRWHHRY
jgi:hypothetical protein